MAKVSGPLQSLSASGKLADCIVFFTWKGWILPNKMDRQNAVKN